MQSLPSWTYSDPDFHALERDKILLGSWQPLCHVSDIPAPGDYHCLDFLGQSGLAVRGRDGRVRAFHNVCRHRGARLLDGARGHCGARITCPYHAWSYGLDGALMGVPDGGQYWAMDRARHGLKALECEQFAGLIFVRFRPGGPSVAEMMAPVADEIAHYRIEDMRPLGRVSRRERAVNWKTVADNYVDLLHIPIAHRQLNGLFGGDYRIEMRGDICRLSGHIAPPRDGGWSARAYATHLPEVEHLPTALRRCWIYYMIWPNFAIELYPDQVDFMQFIPLSATRTVLREIPYGLPGAGRRMAAARYLNWRINRRVSAEDRDLIERVQAGLASDAFTTGPLGENEIGLRHFAARMGALLPAWRRAKSP